MKKIKKKKNRIKRRKRIKTRSKIQKRKKPIKSKNRIKKKKKKKIYKRKVKRVIKAEKTKLHQREEKHRLDEEIEQRLEQQKQEEQINQPDEEKKKRLNGTVKWFNDAKGYGFIKRADKEKDIFVHFSAVKNSGLKYLKEDEQLTFEVEYSDKGPSAVNLQKTVNVNEVPRSHLKVVK